MTPQNNTIYYCIRSGKKWTSFRKFNAHSISYTVFIDDFGTEKTLADEFIKEYFVNSLSETNNSKFLNPIFKRYAWIIAHGRKYG